MNWLSKFFLTYGFGSVGSIAKWMAVNYTKAKKKFPKKTHRELLLHLIELRYPNGKAIIGPERLPEPSMAIIEKCQGSLEKITMYIEHLEHNELDEVKITRPYLYRAVKKIVRERLNKFAPDIKRDLIDDALEVFKSGKGIKNDNWSIEPIAKNFCSISFPEDKETEK